MPSTDPAVVERVVARFFQTRSAGRRPSIDHVLDEFGSSAERAQLRTQVASRLSAIFRQAANDSPAPDSPLSRQPLPEPGPAPTLDDYDIIDIVGRGGMGIVYEAYQRSTGRRVAVKFVSQHLASSESIRRRFEREVDLIARLDHPALVAILDSGVHRGQYFYAMEFVEGLPLDEALEPGEADPRTTLSLIAVIADAVHYAHQRGVIHRDLKPSNILLDADGNPHILDFGLAKAFDPLSGSARLTLSEPGQLLGTPEYMSPEQTRTGFEDLTPRTDQYSLAVVAFQLLTGKFPIKTEGPWADVLRAIEFEEPARPSSFRSSLDADVDAILVKALAKRPDERYESCEQFAADIRRWLGARTVIARPAGAVTRLNRWARRNRQPVRVGVIVGAVGLLAAASLGGIALVQAREIRQANERASLVTAAVDQLEQTFPQQDVDREAFAAAKAKVEAAAKRLDESPPTVPEAEFTERIAIGRAEFMLNRYDQAKTHIARAVEIGQNIYADNPERLVDAIIELGKATRRSGHTEESLNLYTRAETIAADALPPDTPLSLPLFKARNAKAIALDALKRSEEAEALARETIALASAPGSGIPERDIWMLQSTRALALLNAKRLDESIALYNQVADYHRTRNIEPDARPVLAITLTNLAKANMIRGDKDAGLAAATESLDIRRALHQQAQAPAEVASALDILARIHAARGDLPSSEAAWRECLEYQSMSSGDAMWRTAEVRISLANCLAAQKKYPDAEALLLQAIFNLETQQAVPKARQARVNALTSLVKLYTDSNQPDKLADAQARLDAAKPPPTPPPTPPPPP